MKLAVWNVNSIRARHDRFLAFLERESPDVVALQETKVPDDVFPAEAVAAAGYEMALYGQKTYNGVALISKMPPEDVVRGFNDGEEEDPQSRLIAATYGDVRVICAYMPNGSTVGSDKWDYKLAWMARLERYLSRLSPDDSVILCGDFNVAPDERDAKNPEQWVDSVLMHEDSRGALTRIRDWGFLDAVRLHHTGSGPFTWWDYRNLGFQKNNGLRIDHVYITEALAP
jgi:exodeoxyribonuclease-3